MITSTFITWILSIVSSLLVLGISIILTRWFKITDEIKKELQDLRKHSYQLENRVNTMEVGVFKDIEHLNDAISALKTAIDKLTIKLESIA